MAISLAAVTTALAPGVMAATPPHRLISSTVLAATGPPAAVTPAVATLTEGILPTMTLKTLKLVTVTAFAVLATAGFATHLVQATFGSRNCWERQRRFQFRPHRSGLSGSRRRSITCAISSPMSCFRSASHMALGATAAADDKPALGGVWVRKEGEMKLDFTEKDVLTLTPHGENKVVVLQCECSLNKEGVVKAKITDISGKEAAVKMIKEKLPLGTEFSFKWTVKDGSSTLEDLKGEKIELFKSLLEGEFEKK